MPSLVKPPDPPPIDPLGWSGAYSAPTMWDEDEWASPTPCHVKWVVRRIAELEIEGRLDVCCPACGNTWTVIWDPWRPEGRGHAVWVEA